MYLKEFALGNFIDETNQTLSSTIKDNLIYIIKYFINNKDLFQCLPDKLKDKTQSLDCVLFINELISYVNESFYGKREIFNILCDYGIISAISQILREENESKNNESLLKSNIIKIIYNFIKSTPDLFNDYLFMKTFQNDNMNINNNITLIEHLCDVLITSDDFGIKYEIGNIIKNIIEIILLEQGFYNYILYDPPQRTTIEDINIDSGGTAWDLLTQLRDINSNWEMFFDVDGVFHFQQIPNGKVNVGGTLTMEADGDPTTFEMTIKALKAEGKTLVKFYHLDVNSSEQVGTHESNNVQSTT